MGESYGRIEINQEHFIQLRQ